MTDKEIVDLYWDRDETAIENTKTKYEHYLTKISYNILYDFMECEECVNDTYLAAWNSMPENRPSVLSTYLGRIVRQISIDVFRKKTSKKRSGASYAVSLDELSDICSDGSSIDDEMGIKQLAEIVERFLSTVSDDARNLFIGRYYFFDSLKEAAGYCGMSEQKAKSILFRTRKKLKAYLVKEGYDL